MISKIYKILWCYIGHINTHRSDLMSRTDQWKYISMFKSESYAWLGLWVPYSYPWCLLLALWPHLLLKVIKWKIGSYPIILMGKMLKNAQNCQLRNLNRIRKFLDTDTCHNIVCTLILSKLDHCNSLLYGIDKKNISIVFKFFKTNVPG